MANIINILSDVIDKDNVNALHLYRKYGFTEVLFDGADEHGEYFVNEEGELMCCVECVLEHHFVHKMEA